MSDVLLVEQATPSTPSAGQVLLYPKSDHGMYIKDSTGAETALVVSLLSALPRATGGGTVDAITATFSPALALTDQVACILVSAGANTSTTPTFAPNALTAHTITTRGGAALVAGDIGPAGYGCLLIYNSANTRWELMNPAKTLVADVAGVTVQTAGKQTIWVPAGAMMARTTNGAALGTDVESATNKVMLHTMDFADGASILYAQFSVRMPKSWDAGTVTAAPVWTANSTSTNSVVWGVQGVSLANDETIDAAFGTAQTVTDANTATAYQIHLATESSAITIAGAGNSEWVVFQIYRDPTNGSDTLAATAKLIGVNIYYTTNAANDA